MIALIHAKGLLPRDAWTSLKIIHSKEIVALHSKVNASLVGKLYREYVIRSLGLRKAIYLHFDFGAKYIIKWMKFK